MLKAINGGKLPTKGTKYSACIDLYANEDVVIGAGETAIVGLGVCIDMEYIKYLNMVEWVNSDDKSDGHTLDKESCLLFFQNHQLNLYPRSSLSAKGLISNVGIIDLDYKDEINLIVYNTTKTDFYITRGDRIAQIQLVEHKTNLIGVHTETKRIGGIGSTN
tara:strand:- start:1202 stop:1687 length:486 start_codon:yes stop_codon:yes gene_type:complete